MIDLKVVNQEGPAKMGKAMFIRKAEFLADFAKTQELMAEAIQQAVENLLGQGAMDHFQISRVGSNQYGERISVIAKDDVGKYIYYGTAPHVIGAGGRFLDNTTNDPGFGPIRGPVNHPGTPAKGPEIEKEIEYARLRVLAIMRKK